MTGEDQKINDSNKNGAAPQHPRAAPESPWGQILRPKFSCLKRALSHYYPNMRFR